MENVFSIEKLDPAECVLALDLDGTLTNSKKEITHGVKTALWKFADCGGKIILASGRPTYGIVPVARELELEKKGGYILSYNGGCVTDCMTGEIVYQSPLPDKSVPVLASQAKEYDVNILTYQDEFIVTEDPEEQYCQKESWINHMKIKKVDRFAEYVDFPVIKCLMTGDGEYLQSIEEKMKAYWRDDLSICRSEPYFLEVTAKDIDKAKTLDKILASIGKSRSKLIACGDGFNDMSMISCAGIGVAMANASLAVKDLADYIAPSNDEDGIADVVSQLFKYR